MNTASLRWHLLEDAEAVAREASRRILNAAALAIAERGCFRIVLAGGRTPEQAYRLLAAADSDWARWEIYYGDERCLPENSPERNSLMVSRVWLDHVPIPADQVHPIPAQLGPVEAARRYAAQVAAALPFDLVLLGLGEDGHTASLFPDQPHPGNDLVQAVFAAPKPPPERVSLSVHALSNTHELLVLVTGAGKRAAVAAWRRGARLPIGQLHPVAGIDVLIDRLAHD